MYAVLWIFDLCCVTKIIFADRHTFITLPKQMVNLPFVMNCPENSVISVIRKGIFQIPILT